MRIAVTGAGGFIGSHLTRELAGAGHDVIGIVQTKESGGTPGVKVTPIDITAREVPPDVFAGAEAVIHLAARLHVLKDVARDPLTEYRKVNVNGTANVVRGAVRAGVRRFFHFSSSKAMGEGSWEILDEESPCRPETPYGISKLESECVFRSEAEAAGMTGVIFRLPMVYGPENKGNFLRMLRWADRGLPFPVVRPYNKRSMVYVRNVVAGVMASLESPRFAPASCATYILKDSEDFSTRIIYALICRELGKTPRFLPLPKALVRFGTTISDDIRKMTSSFLVSSEKVKRELGFSPPFKLEEGIAETVRWYRRSAR